LKLKDIYLRVGKMDKAADECLELARIHEGRGESARASDFVAEAHQLNPLLGPAPIPQSQDAAGWSGEAERAFGFEENIVASGPIAEPERDDLGGFEVREATSGLDLTQYQTGSLSDMGGFVTLPGGAPSRPYSEDERRSDHRPMGDLSDPFRYSDTLVSEDEEPSNPVADVMFNSAGDLASDTMSGILRDELEGIDFYIAQGYFEIARDTLERLRSEHGNHPEIVARYKRLGASGDLPPVPTTGELIDNSAIDSEPEQPMIDSTFGVDSSLISNGNGANGQPMIMSMEDDYGLGDDVSYTDEMTVDVQSMPSDGERKNVMPLMVHKESGPLDRDLLVQFNTSELINSPEFEALISSPSVTPEPEPIESPIEQASKPPSIPLPHRVGTSELMETFLSGLDASFADVGRSVEVEPPSPPAFFEETVEEEEPAYDYDQQEPEPPLASMPESLPSAELHDGEGVETELQAMLEDLKGNTGDLPQAIDYETHFNLGLAYKDMDLLDEAIEQFQMASKLATIAAIDGNYIQCCHMLGVCFKLKGMPKVAVMWFERGLRVQNRAEDEYQALRYEIGLCYEEMGNLPEAIEAFMEVFGIDVNYRSVGDKIKELQAAKNA
jgi:tetratricopeptide (TPR) repeat protein